MAGMVPYQELLALLRRREEEIRALREERTSKDATIDFLKTKIATLQNRLAVESLQGSDGEELQQSLEKERRRNEEMSTELQHAALEIDDLRTELKEARAVAASLQTEVEKPILHPTTGENHNGVLKEHNVLIASVEELERELAQDATKAAEAQPVPFAAVSGSDEGVAPLANDGGTEELPPPAEGPDDVRVEASAGPEGELETALEAPDAKAEEVEEDSPPEAGEMHVSASGALLNFFDRSEDAGTLEARRQKVARQIERRRQARSLAKKTEETPSRPSVAGRPGAASTELPLRREEVKSMDDSLVGSQQSASDINIKATACNETTSVLEVRAQSAVAPAGRSIRVGASSCRHTSSDGQGHASPTRSASAADTPTLHSKFEGLRDEMKRRRSQHNVADPLETAEAVVAEAKTSGLLTFGNILEASPPTSYRHVIRTRSGSPLRSTSHAATPHSASFTPLGRCYSSIQASPGGSVTLPSTPKRGMVIPTAGVAHGQRMPPSVGLYQPTSVTGGGSLVAPVSSRSFVMATPSPGPAQHCEDGGWRPSPSSASPPATAPPGYVVAQTATAAPAAARSVVAPSFAYRGEDVAVVLSSSAAVPSAPPGELDRSRRSAAIAPRNFGHAGSSSTGHLGGYTSRPSPQPDPESDSLHDAVQRFCRHHPVRLPLARLSRGVYLYGNKKLLLTVHNGKLLVRIGGGFATLESCISEADRAASVVNGCRRSRTSY